MDLFHLQFNSGKEESAGSDEELPPRNVPSRRRAPYDLVPGGPRAGPLSVNDPQLRGPTTFTPLLSKAFIALQSPFGPPGRRNQMRGTHYRIHISHIHQLLRAMMAAHDYAGAARVLATLHRLHENFDPHVYRYTVAILRLSGDHSVRKRNDHRLLALRGFCR